MMKVEIMKRIRNVSVETAVVFLAICISLIGFIITVMGAFLNGFMMFNGSKDLFQGFGIILIGNSIALLGVIIMSAVFIFNIFKRYLYQTENRT
jgi:hypothetical protein